MLGNENDYLTTRVSYKLHLRGPSVNVQSACSTSLVAMHQAVQALLTWQCDVALAGGVSVAYPQREGYLFQEGGIGSPDGHCRAFDADAPRHRLQQRRRRRRAASRSRRRARRRQPIYAVIRGAARQQRRLREGEFRRAERRRAGRVDRHGACRSPVVLPDSIGYVEAHGTGTPLGDPIEVAALTEAFRAGGATGPSVLRARLGEEQLRPPRFGGGRHRPHQGGARAASRQIPPTLHFREPNPQFNLRRARST